MTYLRGQGVSETNKTRRAKQAPESSMLIGRRNRGGDSTFTIFHHGTVMLTSAQLQEACLPLSVDSRTRPCHVSISLPLIH